MVRGVTISKNELPLAIRITLITRMMVGFMGMNLDSTSSKAIPTIDKITMPTSNRFHLRRTNIYDMSENFIDSAEEKITRICLLTYLSLTYKRKPKATNFIADSKTKTAVKK